MMKITKKELKTIIKEEVKQILLSEATRWNVGIEGKDGRVVAVYGHNSGYLEGVGKTLKTYYKDPNKIKKLMLLGRYGISSLAKEISGAPGHSFNTPKPDQTVFYGRDRHEKNPQMSDTYKDRIEYSSRADNDYAYLYSLEDKKWYYIKVGIDRWWKEL